MVNNSNIIKAVLLFVGLCFASINSIAQPYIRINKKSGTQEIRETIEHYDGAYLATEFYGTLNYVGK